MTAKPLDREDLVKTINVHNVNRDTLLLLPEPEKLGSRHLPIPHHELISTLDKVLRDYGFNITHEHFALSGEQTNWAKIFGTLQLRRFDEEPWLDGVGQSLGIRSANDGSISVQMVAGANVFVCSNGIFSGDTVVMRRKHTTGIRLMEEFEIAVQSLMTNAELLKDQIQRAGESVLSVTAAKALIADAFNYRGQGKVPLRLFSKVMDVFLNHGDYPDSGCGGQTVWDVHNALTYAIREVPLTSRFAITQRLGGLLASVES